MSEIKHLRFMLRLASQGEEAWHGPSLRSVLDGVDAAQARARPIAGAHSIFELVHHIAFWRRQVVAALVGEDFADGTVDERAFPADQTVDEEAWQAALGDLAASQEQLLYELRRFPEERLHEKVPGRDYSFYFVLHGILHHDLYHSGQIALLKKG